MRNQKVLFVLFAMLLISGTMANAGYVPFSVVESSLIYQYNLNGPGDGLASVDLTSALPGGPALTAVGNVTSYPSPNGGCAYFEANSGAQWPNFGYAYVTADPVGIPEGTTELYVDYMVKPYNTVFIGAEGIMISKNNAFAISAEADGSLAVFLGNGTTWNASTFFATAAGVFHAAEWYNVRLQVTETSAELFVDQGLVGSKTFSSLTMEGGGELTLANWDHNYSSNLFGGMIDEVKVSAVPEPSSLALVAAGLFGLLAYAWRKRQ